MDSLQEHNICEDDENKAIEEYEKKAESILEKTSFNEFMQDDGVCANLNNCFVDFLYEKVEPRIHKVMRHIDIDTKIGFNINDDFMNELLHIFAHHIARDNIFNKQFILENPEIALGYIERKIKEDENPTKTKASKAIHTIHPRYMKIHHWNKNSSKTKQNKNKTTR